MLFTPLQVGLASALGSPLAGGWLLFRNARALGRGGWAFLLLGLGLLVGLVLLTLFTEPLMGAVCLLASGFVMGGVATLAHREDDIRSPAPLWLAVALGVGFMTVQVMVGFGVLALVLLFGVERPRDYAYAPHCNICVYSSVTMAEAQALGDGLKAQGYFNGLDERSVDFLREDGTLHVRIWVENDGWREPDTVARYAEMARQLSSSQFAGAPLVIDLMDHQGDMRASVP